MNFDGASEGNPSVAAGRGVLRGHRGEWIKGFTENFGECMSGKAELKAALHGLQMPQDSGLRKVWFRVDSMIAVGML